MNKLIISSVISLMLFNTSYAEDSNDASDGEVIKLCKLIEEVAKMTMESRQSGVPIEEHIKMSGSIENPVTKKMIRNVIFMAYNYPIYPKDTDKQNAALEFSELSTKECLKAFLLDH